MPTGPAIDRRFVHLHLHSEYSLLDGGNRLDKLVRRVKELGMDAVAVTDHGNMHAAVQFGLIAKGEGVKPIMGVEAYVAPADRRSRVQTGVQDGGWHLVLLAEDQRGWENLLYLCSEAYLTGFYYRPRMDREILTSHGDGLIAINGHLGSELAHHLQKYDQTRDRADWDRAVACARWHAETFKPNAKGEPRFYIELQHHVPEQIAINPHLIRLARELDLPLVCDNDSHFLRAEDHDAHDTLICISTGKAKSDTARMRYTPELYVKSPEEMWSIFDTSEYNNDRFGDAGREALENTWRIADRCNVDLPLGANHAPAVRVRRHGTTDADAKPARGKKHDPWVGLPEPSDPRFAGDLSAWHAAYSAEFEAVPLRFEQGVSDAERERVLAASRAECDDALRRLSEAGMVWRYGNDVLAHRHELIEGTPEAIAARENAADTEAFDKWARLNRELRILADKLISAYFLIVWDFVSWGRQRDIPANARGSGVGTMVGYVLGLSNACPVRYGLLFERFTDPDRSEYPDIDIDLCQDGRADVIRYVREKYGHVAQIITFGTLKARAAVRDVARVLEVPLSEADKLAKLIPEELNITLDRALEQEPDLRKLYDADADVKRLIDNARVLEGQARHASVHAAGVIVATRPLHEVVPLYRQTGSAEDEVVTQWDGPTCEKMGLLKMDFLGLRTLSVIERAKKLIRSTLPEDAIWNAVGRDAGSADGPHPLDLERLTYDDPRVFELFQRGDTTGVFQFESGGMRRLLVEMKPDRLEDLIAANALFRPGPMDLIPDYNRRKHGEDTVPKVHEIVDRFTRETYGVMVYQEQVMQIVHELGGIPLRAAYSLIKAISKKKEKEIAKVRPVFVDGAQQKGLPRDKGEELFEMILKFAGYGFNKSHSTGYAIVAYQTAYLKTFFPKHYMAAFLTFESQAQKVSDWIPYLDDTRRTRTIDPRTGKVLADSIEVRPPDVNLSQAEFAVVYTDGEPRTPANGHIRFGLRAIKGAGDKAIEAVIRERDGTGGEGSSGTRKPFTSLFEFCERVPPGTINKATIEALIKSGAFDSVHSRDARAGMVATIERAVSAGQKLAADKAAGQNQLFGFGGDEPQAAAPVEIPLDNVPAWGEAETLRQEKDTLGFYVSSHPLETWKAWARVFAHQTLTDLRAMKQDQRVIVAAIVQSTRTLVLKQGRNAGQKMAIVTLEDLTSTADAVLFADCYARFGYLLEDDAPKFVLGRLDLSRGDPQVIVDRLVPIDGVPLEKGRLRFLISEPRLNGGSTRAIDALARTILSEGRSGAESGLDTGPGNGPDNTSRAGASPAPTSRAAATLAAGIEPPEVPFDVIVETDAAWYTVRPEGPAARVRLSPELVWATTGVLGEDTARLIGGVAVEVEEKRERRGRPVAAN
ncbi:MAG: DNA polymerase III subunit alpha [Phycisphaerales bacterium]|jgi:DNA polymerase-3 subunit alpha|nr:DNA polymerase III subunit alpha [Phycisphaerales bacterium]